MQPAREKTEGARELAGRCAGDGGTARGKVKSARRSRVERARGSERGGDGREGEGTPDPWKRRTSPQREGQLVSSASVEA